MKNDENALLFSLVHTLPLNLKEITYLVDASNSCAILEYGLMNYVPSLLLEEFSQTLHLLHKIYQNDVCVDDFFFRKETVFFFTEKAHSILRDTYSDRSKNAHSGTNEYSENSMSPKCHIDQIDKESLSGLVRSIEETQSELVHRYLDKDLQRIIELFTFLVKKDKNLYLLSLLFELGYFSLINCVNTREVFSFYNAIFSFKVKAKKSAAALFDVIEGEVPVEGAYTRTTRSMGLVEISRKQFDAEVIVNKKVLMKFRRFNEKYQSANAIHDRIAEEVGKYALPMNTVSFSTCYNDCDTEAEGGLKPFHFLNYQCIGFLSDIKDLPSIQGYINLMKNVAMATSKPMLFKILYKPEVVKMFKNKEFELKGIDLLYVVNELHKEIEMDFADIIYKMSESDIRFLMRSLEYSEHTPCARGACDLEGSLHYKVLILLRDVAKTSKDELFFKISYLILLRAIKLILHEHQCSTKDVLLEIVETVCKIIFLNLRRNPYNFARVMFSYKKPKKEKKEGTKHRGKRLDVVDTLETGVDSLYVGQDSTSSSDREDVDVGDMFYNSKREDSTGNPEHANKQKLHRIFDQRRKSQKAQDDQHELKTGPLGNNAQGEEGSEGDEKEN